MMPTKLHSRARNEDGFTLVEMLTTLVILAVILGMTFSALRVVADSYLAQTAYSDSLRLNTAAMNRMTKAIRGGTEIQQLNGNNLPAFSYAGPDELAVYVSANPVPVLTRYTLDANQELFQALTPANSGTGPYWTFPASPATNSEIASQVPVNTDPELFTYYDTNGAEIDVSNPASRTDSTVLSRIRSVRIALTVQAAPEHGGAVQIINTVELPNLGVIQQ